MKKIFTLMLILMVSFAFAQRGTVSLVSQSDDNNVQLKPSETVDKVHFRSAEKDGDVLLPGNWSDATGVGTYGWIDGPGGPPLGWIFGNNAFEDAGAAQKFIVSDPYSIAGAYFWVGYIDPEATGDVLFAIWDSDNGVGDVIASVSIPVGDITVLSTEDATPDDYMDAFYVAFDNPVEVTGDYIIGVDLSDLPLWEEPGDGFGMVSSLVGDGGGMNLSWIKTSAGWTEATNVNAALDMDVAIFPHIVADDDPDVTHELPFIEHFEGLEEDTPSTWLPEGWLNIDADGDGFSWFWTDWEDEEEELYETYMMSYSWFDGTAYTPDNWLITPAIEFSEVEEDEIIELMFHIATIAQQAEFRAERYEVLISTTDNEPGSFTMIWEEVLPEDKDYFEWLERTADLSAYAGETVYLAFRHYGTSDLFGIALERVEVKVVDGEDQYTLSLMASPSAGGVAHGGGQFSAGEEVSILALPEEGWAFMHWSDIDENVVSASASFSFTMPAHDLTLKAVFAKKIYIINAQPNNENFGTVTGGGNYEHFDVVTLNAVPETGHHFLDWTENGNVVMDGDVPAGEVYIFVAEEDRNLVANFAINIYTIDAVPNDEDFGTVTGGGDYEHFEDVTLAAIPKTGYHFVNWTEDGGVVMDGQQPAGETYTFIAESDRDLMAHFAVNTYEIMAQPNYSDFGSVDGSGTYEHYEVVTLLAIPEPGYHLVNWTEGGQVVMDGDEPAGEVYTFMADRNRNLVANFALNTYEITAQPNNQDFGSVSGAGTYDHFEEVTLTATPETGCYFVEWTENDEVVVDGGQPAGETYTFMAEEDRDLIAIFALTTYLLSFQIVDAYTGYDIHDATITLNGDQHEEGVYVFEELPPGVYPYRVDHEQYFEAEGEVEIVNEDVILVVELQEDDTSVLDPKTLTVNVFPNPAQNAIYVESNILISEIHLVNMLSQRVISKTVNHVLCELNISSLHEGMYFIRVLTEEGLKTLSVQIVR